MGKYYNLMGDMVLFIYLLYEKIYENNFHEP